MTKLAIHHGQSFLLRLINELQVDGHVFLRFPVDHSLKNQNAHQESQRVSKGL